MYGDASSRTETQPGGRIVFTNATLRSLIQSAYALQSFEPDSGGPDWIAEDHFDIVAKAENATTRDVFERMLGTLLVDRFKLATHRETKQLPIYQVVVARNDRRLGPQLHRLDTDCAAIVAAQGGKAAAQNPSAPPPCGMRTRPGIITARAITIAQLVTALFRQMDRLVIDHTSLLGTYDFDLQWTPDPAPSITANTPFPDAPSLFTALEEQLGLKLQPARGPVDVLVIDHVEHPTED